MLPVLPSALLAEVAAIASDASSFTMVPFADAVPIVIPEEAFDNVTVKPLSGSTVLSPATFTVIVLLVSPIAKLTVPDGSAAPTKSVASAGFVPLPVTAHFAVLACETFPARVTVKVNAVLPVLPSALLAEVAAIDSDASSFRIVPLADAVPITAPAEAFDSVTVKSSSASKRLSPATNIVIVLLVSPAAKLTVPFGKLPPTKSLALAAFAPDPATSQFALLAADVSPERVTVKVNGVCPELPSALRAEAEAIDNDAVIGEAPGAVHVLRQPM